MITTIQLRENVKRALDRLKSKNETYEGIIIKMMKQIETQKRKEKELLIEGCKEMAEESLKITKEFESIDGEIDWEWNEN